MCSPTRGWNPFLTCFCWGQTHLQCRIGPRRSLSWSQARCGELRFHGRLRWFLWRAGGSTPELICFSDGLWTRRNCRWAWELPADELNSLPLVKCTLIGSTVLVRCEIRRRSFETGGVVRKNVTNRTDRYYQTCSSNALNKALYIRTSTCVEPSKTPRHGFISISPDYRHRWRRPNHRHSLE